MSTEEKNIKEGENYNSTNKNEIGAPQSKLCGVAAIPGKEFRSKIVFATCPSCKTSAPTIVESTWNLKSCLCCYYYGPYWKCWNLIKGNDWTAKNGVHQCSGCKTEIANYQAC
jgi:hypothetical protein